MDYACSMFPVTFVDAELDKPHPPHEFHNHEDEAIYKLCMSLTMTRVMKSLIAYSRYPRTFPWYARCIAANRENFRRGSRYCYDRNCG